MTTLEKTIVDLFKNGKSPYEIAEKLRTYPNKVRRALQKLGIKPRNHSEAQSQALSSGRIEHPTKGKPRSESTKRAIGEKVFNHWKNLPKEKRELWVENCKKKWENMPADDKRRMYESAGEGIRKAAKEGSSLEKFFVSFLTEQGFDVIFHKQGLIVNDKLEVDIFLPGIKTIIEIDGPTHFLPIWGEDKLKQVISADSHKSGLLLGAGYVVIRIKYLVKKLSNKRRIDLANNVLALLENIRTEFPSLENRFIELEVS